MGGKKRKVTTAKRVKSNFDLQIDAAIGGRILQVRTELAKLDQRAFAARLGVTSPAVAQWEQGKGCTRANLDRIVSEFEVSRDWLHTGVGGPTLSRVVSEMHLLSPDQITVIEAMVRFMVAEKKAGALVTEGVGNKRQRESKNAPRAAHRSRGN